MLLSKEPLFKRLEKSYGRAAFWLARVGAFALAGMMVFTFLDVIGRYFFNAPIVGTVEITELLMGLIIYMGVGLTTFGRGHIRVDVIITYLPRRLQASLDLFTLSIGIAFTLLIFWQLMLKAVDTIEVGDLTQVWFLPVWPVAFIMAVCSLTIPIGLMFLWVESLNKLRTPDGE